MRKMSSNWYSLRWQVLNRDSFTCQYCGRNAPDVVLHVDHKEAQANGGEDSLENLITACSACNIGKNLRPLGIPLVVLPLGHNRKRSSVLDEIIAYLRASNQQGATATEIASALGRHRVTIAKIFIANPSLFQKHHKQKASVYYILT